MLYHHHAYSGTCAMRPTQLLHRGSVQPRMDSDLTQVLDPLLASWGGGMKSSVAPLGGQLVRTTGVTAAPLTARCMMGKARAQIEDKRSGVEEGQRDAERMSVISRCTDVPRSADDIKLKPFISPCHNGNLRTICFQFQKGSLFMSRPLSIYTSLIKTGCGKKKKEKKKVTAGFKASNCSAVVVGRKLDQMNWPSITHWWNGPGGAAVSRQGSVHGKMEIWKRCTHTHTHTPACPHQEHGGRQVF